jgi:hypothetical protein
MPLPQKRERRQNGIADPERVAERLHFSFGALLGLVRFGYVQSLNAAQQFD